ncbi:MAG: hypothetical protein H6711_35010 [Myxococcales bacterium]|nr:hypothetical protein [Myxococcales bacterium]
MCIDGVCALAGQSCGDGVLDPGEACDDGNDVDYDGCTSACAVTKVLDIDAGNYGACVLLSGGALRCWGSGVPSQLGYPSNKQGIGDNDLPGDFGPVVLGGAALAPESGANHNCALREDGAVLCWGTGFYGQLGHGNVNQIGDDEDPADAGPVPLGDVAIALSTYHHHNCAILKGGAVRCWGFNTSGQAGVKYGQNIGDNELPTSFPVASLGGAALAIATGYDHTCAILAGKKMRCWGSNTKGQVGIVGVGGVGIVSHPSDFPPLAYEGVEAIDAGHYTTCAITTGGVLHCWGANAYGQTGHGDTYEIGKLAPPESLPPVDLGAKVVQVSCGQTHTCALVEGGLVRCWGRNQYGQLGLAHTDNIGDDELPKDSPPVKLGAPAIKVVANATHSCALLEGGVVRCWGNNTSGQLGYGNTVTIGDDEHPADVGVVDVF